MNVAIYTRSAMPDSAEHQWQQDACQDLATVLGYEVTRTYRDDSREQAALAELMADVASGAVSVLIVSRYDRLYRSIIQNDRITAALLDAHVKVYAANIGTRPLNDPSTFGAQFIAAIRPSRAVVPYDAN